MNKKMKIVILVIQFLSLICLLMGRVDAVAPSQPKVTAGVDSFGDLYKVSSTSSGGRIVSFIAGASISNANSYTANQVSGSANEYYAYITLPNGTYQVWAKNSAGEYSTATTIHVTNSCKPAETKTNQTGSGTVEGCSMVYSDGRQIDVGGTPSASCAAGYNMTSASSTISYDDCGKKRLPTGLSFRYCTKRYTFVCQKADVTPSPSPTPTPSPTPASSANSKLASLTLSTGNYSPVFSSNTYTYATTTTASQVTIGATLLNSSASFVSGYGPRTENLNIGKNTFLVKAQDGGATSTYTINITRNDTRSAVNTLSYLTVSVGTLSPKFSANTINYTVTIPEDTTSVYIGAGLRNESSSFVSGFEPRTVEVKNGTKASIKVKSESNAVKVYTLTFKTESSGGGSSENSTPTPEPTPEPDDNKAKLEKLELSEGIIDFDPNTFDYNISVDYKVTNISVKAKKKKKKDDVTVNGGENLELDTSNEITIVVTSEDGTKTNTYTIYVTRKNEDIKVSSDSILKDLYINDYKIKFDSKIKEYEVTIKDGVNELEITATPNDEKSTVTIEGNEKLTNGSKIKIRVTAEDGSYTDYFITTRSIKKGGNTFVIVVVVLIILGLLAYLVLRILGYKIYFNLDAITSLFKKKK